MTFFGKEIPTDKINFVMNVVSFILGVIFFIRMQSKLANPETPSPVYNEQHDSLIKIETRLNTRIKELKSIQDTFAKTIRMQETKLAEQNKQVKEKRFEIYSTINNEWDGLNTKDQAAYIDKIMSNLKTKQK